MHKLETPGPLDRHDGPGGVEEKHLQRHWMEQVRGAVLGARARDGLQESDGANRPRLAPDLHLIARAQDQPHGARGIGAPETEMSLCGKLLSPFAFPSIARLRI